MHHTAGIQLPQVAPFPGAHMVGRAACLVVMPMTATRRAQRPPCCCHLQLTGLQVASQNNLFTSCSVKTICWSRLSPTFCTSQQCRFGERYSLFYAPWYTCSERDREDGAAVDDAATISRCTTTKQLTSWTNCILGEGRRVAVHLQ